MKTTLDLDDALLTEAKSMAIKRRTTLKALVEHALRRELAPSFSSSNPHLEKLEVGPLGFLRLKRKVGEQISLEQIKEVQESLDQEELQRAIYPRRK